MAGYQMSAAGVGAVASVGRTPLIANEVMGGAVSARVQVGSDPYAFAPWLGAALSIAGGAGVRLPAIFRRYRLITPTVRIRNGSARGLARHLFNTKGVTLVRDDGFWFAVEEPIDIDAYDRVLLGGRVHTLSPEDYAELVLAGYSANLIKEES